VTICRSLAQRNRESVQGETLVLTRQIDVKEAQAQLQELLSQIASGVEWVLTDKMTPVARLVPISIRAAGLHAGAIWTSPDFDEPLPDEFWMGNK